MLKVSRAYAAMVGRDFVTPDDVKLFVKDALCHRIIIKMERVFDSNVSPESIVDEIVAKTPVPKDFLRR